MSPVARSSGHAGRALAVGTAAVALVMGGLFVVSVVLADRTSTELRIGDQTFQGGKAERLAAEIADRGPILYGDVSGERSRDLILQHIGDDPDTGWYAFRAQPPDKPRSCPWQWQEEQRRFRAECDHSLTAPADGKGLERYPVRVIDGRIDVDINADDRPTTTSTTTTVIESGETPE